MSHNNEKPTVIVCNGVSCGPVGGDRIIRELEQKHGIEVDMPNEKMYLESCPCLGNCDFPVNVEVNDEMLVNVTAEDALKRIEETLDSNNNNTSSKGSGSKNGMPTGNNLDDILSILDG